MMVEDKPIVSTHGTVEPFSTTPTRYRNAEPDGTSSPDVTNKDGARLTRSRSPARWGGSVEQVLTRDRAVTGLVADDTLKQMGYVNGQRLQ